MGDLYDDEKEATQNASNSLLFMVDPLTNQPAQIPGLWYIEMHLANCYHTWGQSNMALYHINRTLDQLGNYQINPDTLTVRLNTRRKFKLLSSYLVQSVTTKQTQRQNNKKKILRLKRNKSSPPMTGIELNEIEERDEPYKKRRSFMNKMIKNGGNKRRRKSNVFSKLFDRFSGSKSKRKQREKKKEQDLQLCLEEDLNLNMNEEYELNEEMEDEMDMNMITMEDEEDEDGEIEYFHNDTDTENENEFDAEHSILNGDGAQMITLEALLSMHMTKGRILIEMKLLREALDLYSYIINECETLIKYHCIINPHHIQLEREFDSIQSPLNEREERE